MPQPNKGTHGKPPVQQPMMGQPGSKPSSGDIRFGIHTKGTKGSKSK